MIFEIIQTNYACIIICILFIVFVATDRSFSSRIETMFYVSIGIVVILMVVDNLELIEARRSYPTLARYVYSAIGYALRPGLAIMITTVMERNHIQNWRSGHLFFYFLLFAVNAIISFVSIFNQCVFGYSPANEFYRGALGILPFITAGVYILFMVIITVTGISRRLKEENIIVFLIALFCILGTVLESVFHLEATLNTACGIGILFYYLFLHVSIYAKDQLTNTYSRRIFYMDIDKLHKSEAFIVGIDMNFLKKINDEQGHAAGDKALITMTSIIQKNLYHACTLYRVGGDEFIILCKNTTEKKMQEMMSIIRWEMEHTPYSFAYGIAAYHKELGIDQATKAADEKMYQMKANMKAQMTEQQI